MSHTTNQIRFLSRADLRARGITFSPVTLWRRAKAGTFPKPAKLSASRNGWPENEIDAWQQACLDARKTTAFPA
jgi:predicted DNA-binding transcriptional regulator AlpA